MKFTITLVVIAVTISIAQKKNLLPSQSSQPNGTPSATILNINRISAWYESNGNQENNPLIGNSGVTYPRSTSTAIYSAGILWGGYVSDGQSGATNPRVNGQAYSVGTQPGAILGTRTGVTEDPANTDVRIFRIRRDFASADLKQDAAELNSIPIADVDSNKINSVRDQYKKDWKEWPAHKGAPFYDVDGDGKYEPEFEIKNGVEVPMLYPTADEPGLSGADQLIWYVANDIRGGNSPWQTKPIGLEMQVTIWGYNYPTNHGLGNSIFKRHRLIYKGTSVTPDTSKITQFYIGQWSDPDLGDAGDDFAGCDSVLGIGYVYNSKTLDSEYRKYNLEPPAVGYILLQGPLAKGIESNYAKYDFGWKKGYSNLPMTSFYHTATGGTYADPPFTLNGSYQYYCLLKGHPPTPQPPPCPPLFKNIKTGLPTKFWSSGDPVTNTGWVDGDLDAAGDRRILLSTGPFEISIGDTQEIIFALVGGLGSDRLASISVMKFFMKQSREYFNYLFPDDPTSVNKNGLQLPREFLLSQNYPNPFNPGTRIQFELPQSGFTTLTIYDGLGREIERLVDEEKEAGEHSIQWNAQEKPSGIYFYRLRSGSYLLTKKMILMK